MMKLPMRIQLTLTPLSLAPTRLPPTAIVCRPQGVIVSTKCIASMIPKAQ